METSQQSFFFAYLPACDRFLIFQTNWIREKLETEFANVVIVTAEHIVAHNSPIYE